MTAVRPSAAPPPAVDAAPGPAPRRVRPPRWLDLRLVLGVLLVLASVLLGARIVSSADATVPVWAVAEDLAAGTELSPEDLVAVDVRLDEAGGAYLSTGTRPAGRTLGRAVREGELLPRSALEESDDLVQLALPVQSGYVPPGLQRGQLVDVYAVADPAAGATAVADGSVTLVVARAPVQALSGRSEGVLSTPTTAVQVVVAVPADDAADVLAAIAGRPLVVVVHESVDVDEVDAGTVGSRAAIGGAPAAGATTSAPAGPAG
ncbi:SAF domain-containing protein [Blastococcus colisei]|uniref:SAF domain-containing protein n=1 Tax=Blastococcus colisei TaxID=1564162 RepID=A0A543PBU2_9ACTN|nr:SAF domain-containing protein [Blastococcus colisei]TQN41559.1 SAF domain-containing protein [Blastococcus colisei]